MPVPVYSVHGTLYMKFIFTWKLRGCSSPTSVEHSQQKGNFVCCFRWDLMHRWKLYPRIQLENIPYITLNSISSATVKHSKMLEVMQTSIKWASHWSAGMLLKPCSYIKLINDPKRYRKFEIVFLAHSHFLSLSPLPFNLSVPVHVTWQLKGRAPIHAPCALAVVFYGLCCKFSLKALYKFSFQWQIEKLVHLPKTQSHNLSSLLNDKSVSFSL